MGTPSWSPQAELRPWCALPDKFPGFVTLPGEGQVPTLGFSWEHYQAAQAPPEEIIDGVLCHTRAEMVIRSFWVNYPFT